MKLTLLQENLNSALTTVSHFLPSRPTLPVLGNILLATEKNRLKISATNLEMGINYFVGAKIENEGKTTVLARPFLEKRRLGGRLRRVSGALSGDAGGRISPNLHRFFFKNKL